MSEEEFVILVAEGAYTTFSSPLVQLCAMSANDFPFVSGIKKMQKTTMPASMPAKTRNVYDERDSFIAGRA
uniref:Uncharacterized protein n=1 Tax=Arion vulgaris TaxID=1028688 RepID=A0A0B7B5Y3_9EUPU